MHIDTYCHHYLCCHQVEGLLDDMDFRAHVTRDELETMCSDLFDKIGDVVKDALKSSEVTMVGALNFSQMIRVF